MSDDTFDVFLSHNSKDKPVVRQIGEALQKRGLKVWLDEWELIPGRRWIPELEKAIENTKTAAVMVGENGFGPWEQPEYEAALSEFVKRGLPVIPVLLPGAPEKPKLPLFLTGFTWVDLRRGVTEEGVDRLEWGIRGEKPSPRKNRRMPGGPRIHNLPFPTLGDLLKGRDDELQRLRTNLDTSGHPTAITQTQTIHGLGGIGKTRLAIEYAWRSGDRYDFALFVVADSPEALRLSLVSLARPGLLALPEYEVGAESKALEAVLRWFQEHDRWLLILDNVDDKEAAKAVTEILPFLANGHVLITSRVREWPPNIKRQPLEILTLDEAQRFLLQRTQEDRHLADDDPAQAISLAQELGGLPLALEQAGAYIAHNQMSFAAYLESWRNEREEVLAWYDPTTMQYPASVAATWQATFHHLSPTAAAILRLTAHLAPEPIPQDMFEKGEDLVREAVELLCEEIGQKADSGSVKDGIAELATYSMINRKGTSFTVHRLVREVIRTRISEKRRKDWTEKSLRVVNRFIVLDVDDIRTWLVWKILDLHALEAIDWALRSGTTDPAVQLMCQSILQRYAMQHEDMRKIETEIGFLLKDKFWMRGDIEMLLAFEPFMRMSLEFLEKNLGANHPSTQTIRRNLALLLTESEGSSTSPNTEE
ncbi:MAG TPA: TIR domain-containing protein [Thermoanaerobaculia bacterium]